MSWRVGYVGIFWWDEEDKLYTATNIYQCSGPDFRLRLKRPPGRRRYRSSGRSSFLPSKDEAPTHGPWRQTCQRGRRCAGAGDAAVLSASLPRYNKSVQSSNAPTMCRPDKKYARTQRAFTLPSSVSTPRRQLINLPLHIPEPLSMTRAAISSSSAMVAVGSFVGQVLLCGQQVFALCCSVLEVRKS